jgi:squalene-associated FAD-dependent desaturase
MTRVTVIGGGLAGITAALALADAGAGVTLVEAKPRLGGLTTSFRRGTLHVDNGQHVFMRCCTSYRALLDRLDVSGSVALQPRLDVPVIRARDGRRARLRRDDLPAPVHLVRSLARFGVLSLPDRMRATSAALALRAVDRHAPMTDDRSFGQWLDQHGQTSAARHALWDLVGVATTNAYAEDVSLAVAATVFQIGLLTRTDAADLGWSLVPLQQLHGAAAQRAFDRVGVEVRLRSRVNAITQMRDGWRTHSSDDEIRSDAVVVATDPRHAEELLPPDALALPSGWANHLGAAPIVNIHVVVDRRVMDEPFVAGIGGPVQWVFDRTEQSGLRGGQYLAVSLSAADQWIDLSVAHLQEVFMPALRQLLPQLAHAQIRDFFVTRERAATFRPAPGVARWRPPAITTYEGLVVAGAHCATGWPATMESAVRSGQAAAAAVLSRGRVASEVAA